MLHSMVAMQLTFWLFWVFDAAYCAGLVAVMAAVLLLLGVPERVLRRCISKDTSKVIARFLAEQAEHPCNSFGACDEMSHVDRRRL